MRSFSIHHGLSTLLNHLAEGDNPHQAHVTPIYQSSVFSFPDFATGLALETGQQPGYIYSRLGNPNTQQLAFKIAALEGLDLLRAQPDLPLEQVVAGQVFASGMAAITAAVLGRVSAGDTILAQQALYGQTFNLLDQVITRLGIRVVWVQDLSPDGWQEAFAEHPEARLAYVETPVNPTLQVIDLQAIAEMAHRQDCWLVVDNTFATPYCQRPLTLGADVVVHSTTKYLSGHGLIIGGALASRHPDFVHRQVQDMLVLLGACASPFDAWLTNTGLKTFELRMRQHCANALALARFLEGYPQVSAVHYPGLESHPGHELASRQMYAYGGMLSFELKGGFPAAVTVMDRVRVITLAVSLGNLDSLIQHPASMTHSGMTPEERQRMGIGDGLLRLSVGVENTEDLIADLDQALADLPA